MDISWNNLAQAQVNYYSLLDSTDNLRGNGLNLKLRSANADMNYNFSRNSTFVLSEWELAVIKCFKKCFSCQTRNSSFSPYLNPDTQEYVKYVCFDRN